jgi:hypothetical protein
MMLKKRNLYPLELKQKGANNPFKEWNMIMKQSYTFKNSSLHYDQKVYLFLLVCRLHYNVII